ncbi:MAG: prolyl oligopeptidase family serine peptidase [Candidatus Poribacteria bacterium]
MKIYKIIIVFLILVQCFIINCLYGEDATKGGKMEAIEKKLPIDGEVFAVKGHVAFLIMPAKQESKAKTPWVWYAPTLPGLPGVEEKWMFEKFLNAGIAIAGIDVGESFGNPQGRELFTALYDELVKKHGLSKKVCLLARSRGGLMLYNWAVEHPKSIACITGIYPVCNLSSYPGLKNAAPAYGMTEEELKEKLAEHNPIDRLQSLAKEHVPVFFIHGDIDTAVPLELNSGEFAKRYRQFGGDAEVLVPKGQGHNMWTGFFQCQELVDFVIDHSKKKK